MDKRFRVAVAGCGGMSSRWIAYATAREDVEIVALVDIQIETARKTKERLQLPCPVFDDLSAALSETGASLVFDVTNPQSHRDVVLAAFSHGCNVMGEKPMATTLDHAHEILAAADRAERRYSVMQNRRYNPQIRSCQSLVASGAIGDINFVCADFFLGPHFGGFREAMESPLILDMAIHTFDQARFITGLNPVSVYCHEFNPASSWYAGGAAAVCIFELTNGAVFCYRGSWCAEGLPTSWDASWRVVGSRGTVLWDGTASPTSEVISASHPHKLLRDVKPIRPDLTWTKREGHDGCLDEMFQALIEDRRAETDCHDNIRSVEMVFAACESAREMRKIDLADSQQCLEP